MDISDETGRCCGAATGRDAGWGDGEGAFCGAAADRGTLEDRDAFAARACFGVEGAVQATRDVALPAVAARNPFASAASSQIAGSDSCDGERLVLRKVACAIRELDTFEGDLVFHLGERLGASASSACVRAATCATVRAGELARCAVKLIDDRERAENEWFHLTTYRSPLFPAPFLFARVASCAAPAAPGSSAAPAAPAALGSCAALAPATPAAPAVPGESNSPASLAAPNAPASPARYAIVMELIEGPTLAQLIAAGFGEDEGPAPVEKTLEIMSPFAASFKVLSLSFRGFVHRDIKPANIIVTGGACKTRLVDLGVSAHEQDRLQHKHAGATPGFAPLEIERPQDYPANSPVSYCDARIDSYSIAATFYALLMGRAPADYGARLEACDLRHDAGIVAAVREQARASIASKHGRLLDDAVLDELVTRTVRAADARLAAVVTRGLSRLQADRPTPGELFDALPTHYAATLVDAVQVAYLERLAGVDEGRSAGEGASSCAGALRTVSLTRGDEVHLTDTPLSDDYRYEGFLDDFHRAIELWNRGDYRACVPLFEKLAAAGDATAQYNLGVCYRDSLGVERNDAKKLAFWTRAAEAGNIVAAYNVAVCHEKGDGIPAMPEAALMWYRRSAREGFPAAIEWMLDHGEPLEE